MRKFALSSSLLGLAAAGLLTGCPDRTISEVTPQQGRVEYKDIPVTLNRDIDILFVIDDSPSMADKQLNLRDNFPQFINVLNTIEGGLPDVHIGVVTTDMGSKGSQDSAPGAGIGQPGNGGCTGTGDAGNLQVFSAPVSGTFISDIRDPDNAAARIRNYTGDLATVFGQMATGAGAGGCGFEQPLAAMKAALAGNPANTGFLRPAAYLAVIFIADEDDCTFSKSTMLGPESAALGPQQSFRCTRFGVTCDIAGTSPDTMNQVGTKDQCHPNESSAYMEKVQTYVDFLKGLKTDASKVIVAGIMGTSEPFQVELRSPLGGSTAQPALARSCSYVGGGGMTQVADPPIRLKFLLDQFPGRSTFTTICQQDLTDGLVLIAELLKSVLGNPCIEGDLADADPNTPGDQYDCSVSYVTNQGKPNQAEQVLPACDATSSVKPCWKIDTDTVKCTTTPEGFILVVDKDVEPPDDSHIVAYCVTEAN